MRTRAAGALGAETARYAGASPRREFQLLTDEELVRGTARGDHSAFEVLVERHRSAVVRLLRLLRVPPQDIDDLVQQTFLAVFRYAGHYRGEAAFFTWLCRIAKNAAYHSRRRQSRQAQWVLEVTMPAGHVGWAADNPEQLAIRSQRRTTLHRIVASLAPSDRQVIALRILRGLSGEDTARILGIGVPAVKTRLHRARSRLLAAWQADQAAFARP